MAYTTIDNPVEYFNTKLYTGTGATQSITGVGFQPDWVWFKNRSTTNSHSLFDIVRGTTKNLITNSTAAESTNAQGLTSFNSDGFTVGNDADVNGSSNNMVAWNWLASNTSGSSNTSGTITSTVSANTTSGFSIVSWTGTGANATVGHSLGTTPSMIIVKNRSAVEDWTIYHSALGNTKFLDFTLGASQTSSTIWNNTSPTSTLFTVGTNSKVNGNTNNMIAYCFAEVKGYSKFGSYTGNGSTDGTFVYTGFKPAFVITKRSDSTSPWYMMTGKASDSGGGNFLDRPLFANSSQAENDGDNKVDFISNGFKYYDLGANQNASGGTYIYMAFAENPFVSSTGIPCTAR